MAKVILSTNDSSYTVAAGNTSEIIGTNAAETITVQQGATVTLDASFNQGGDTLVLSGIASNYTMELNGATVTLRDAQSGSVIEIPAGTAGADIQFADGTQELKIDTAVGAVMLGNQQITSTAATVNGGTIIPTPSTDKVFTLTEVTETTKSFVYDGVDLGAIDNMLQYLEEYQTAVDHGQNNGVDVVNQASSVSALQDSVGLEYLQLMQELVINNIDYIDETTVFVPAQLTTAMNNAAVIESGFTTDANELIVAGTPYALHGAYINAGGGYNILEVDMKGPFAQPKQLLNIQEVQVQNLTNYYGVDGAAYANLFSDVFTNSVDSILDLSRASSLQKVVVTESGAGGNLTVLGMQNYATARFEGSFDQDVTLHYSGSQGDALNVEMANVTAAGNLNVAHNVGKVVLNSDGYSNILQHANFGSHLQELVVTGDAMLSIESGLNFAFGEATINAGSNTGGVRLDVGTVTANLDEVTITGSQTDDEITVSGTAAGVKLAIDTGTGEDTVIVDTVDAGEGSVISGDNLTLIADGGHSDLTKADISGVDAVVLHNGTDLTLTQAQVTALGAAAFDANHDDAVVLTVEITADTELANLLDLTALDSAVKLKLNVADGATLTLTAEQLHAFIAEDGIDVSAGLNGQVILTDAGVGFDAFAAGTGSLSDTFGTSDDLTIVRSESGFERPAAGNSSDTLTIDTTGTAAKVIDGLDAPQVGTLKIEGDQNAEFTGPVTLGNNFTLDLSGMTNGATVVDMTLTDFNNVTEVIGNGVAGTRINVELDGNVGAPGADSGLMSNGVAQYVVTDLNGADHDFNVCDNTQDVEVLGLQGNQGDAVTFNQVPWGAVNPSILLEGDGFNNWDQLPKAAGNPDESNIGTVNVNFFYAGAPAVVNINNQGNTTGQTSEGTDRPLVVDAINVTNAKSLTLNIEDADAVIAGVEGDAGLETLALNSANDVMLNLDGLDDALTAIDASGVTGDTTLHVSQGQDLSETTLTGIDAIQIANGDAVVLTMDQITAIDVANITVDTVGGAATLHVAGLANDAFSLPTAADGISLGAVMVAEQAVVTLDAATDLTGATSVIVAADTVLNLTAAQFMQFGTYDAVTGNLTNAPIITGAGSVNITALTQADVDKGFSLANVTATAGLLTLAADIVLAAGSDLGEIAIELATGQTINMATVAQASARDVSVATGATDTTVEFAFTNNNDGSAATGVDFDGNGTIGDGVDDAVGNDEENAIDMSDYSADLTTVKVKAALLADENVEQVLGQLNSAITIDIFTPSVNTVAVNGTNRIVVAEADAVVSGDLEFDDLQGNVRVETLDLTLQGGVYIGGGLDVAEATAGLAGFEKLTINSEGALEANTIGDGSGPFNGDIIATGNNLLDVEINATQALIINGDIVFTVEGDADGVVNGVDDAAATLTVNGTADVTIATLNVNDTDVDTLNVVNNSTGTLTVPGNSPATVMDAGAGDVSTLNLSGAGDITLGSAIAEADWQVAGEPEFKAGISNDVATIDASNLTGDLNLGHIVVNVDADASFTVTAGSGVTTMILGDPNDTGAATPFTMNAEADVSIDLSNAAAGSAVTLTGDAVLPDMTATLAADAGSFVINTGANGKLIIDGPVDLRTLIDVDGNNKLDLSGVASIEIADGGSVQMTDAQWDALTPAQQGAIAGAGQTLQITDDSFAAYTTMAGIDLTDVRSVTAIQIDDDLAVGAIPLILTDAQAAITTSGTFAAVTGVFTATQWDHDADAGVTTAEVAREAGDFRDLDVVTVQVQGDADLSALEGVDVIDMDLPADTLAALTITDAQMAALELGNNDTDADVALLSDLLQGVEVQTGADPVTAAPVFQTLNIDYDFTRDVNGAITETTATGHAGAIAAAANGLTVDTLNWTHVGSEISFAQAGLAVALDNTGASDVYQFVAAPDAAGYVEINDFKDADAPNGTDQLDLSAFGTVAAGAAGTLAKVAITNAAADDSFTVDGVNTTVYVIDTDANALDNVGPNSIADFTNLAEVAAFLDTGVTTSDVADEVHYFVINDGAGSSDAYLYKFVDAGGDTAVDAGELQVIGHLNSPDAAIVVADILIS